MLFYVHVPFCVHKCHYCAFHSQSFSPLDLQEYVRLCCMEISQWSQKLNHHQVQTIYIGGGTPSVLTGNQIEQILRTIEQCFVVHSQVEITLEANPESISRALLTHVQQIGVNRLSLGIQSMSDACLQLLGRPHNKQQASQAVQWAREAGFSNISLDCMWGIPDQSVKHWAQDLTEILSLKPDHLSAYGLILEKGTKITRAVHQGQWSMPDDEDLAQMYFILVEKTQNSGLKQYEISNFAQPGKISIHNSGYWDGLDYLGIGPAAVSTIGQHRWQNPSNHGQYAQLVTCGFQERTKEFLDLKTRWQEEIMLSLRTTKGLALRKFKAENIDNLPDDLQSLIQQLEDKNLAQLKAEHLCLTPLGMLVSNSIIELVLDLLDHHYFETRIL